MRQDLALARAVILVAALTTLAGCASSSAGRRPGSADPLAPREYGQALSHVFSQARLAMLDLGWQVKSVDERAGTLIGYTQGSLRSWTEQVTVTVYPTPAGRVRVQLNSQAFQLFDWGKNSDNIRDYFRALDIRIEQSGEPPVRKPPVPMARLLLAH
jgi:hypothetical protein